MQLECVSTVPFINWGQVISVTAQNVLSADKVMLTFFGEESTKIKKSPRRQGGEEIKLPLHSPVRNENQSAGPQFTLTASQRL